MFPGILPITPTPSVYSPSGNEVLSPVRVSSPDGGSSLPSEYYNNPGDNSGLTAALNWSDIYGMIQTAFRETQNLDAQERAFNSAEAQKNRDFQERMSNTSIQRMVKDLEAAGLNKWLALNGGGFNGSSTPSGASATYSSGSQTASSILRAFISYLTTIQNTGLKSFTSLFGSLISGLFKD